MKAKFISKTKLSIYALAITSAALMVQGWRSAGPAFAGVGGRTGAPGEGNCSDCHGGGGYTPNALIEIFENGTTTPATSYQPGSTYDLKVSVSSSSGTPIAYGFQLVPLTASNVMAGSYNTLGSGVRQSTSGSRTYLEHNAPKATGTFTSKWVAPALGTGTVSFYANGNCINNTGGTGGDNSIATTLVLPEFSIVTSVKITNFGIQELNTKNKLSWTTTQEINNSFFTIEHSQDGKNFAQLDVVKTHATQGNSEEALSYDYTHNNVALGHNYYRLSQTDIDGRTTLASTVLHQFNQNKNEDFIVYPNPVENTVSIKLNETETSTLVLTDMLGNVIKRMEVSGANQTQQYSFSTEYLQAGTYAILVQRNGKTIDARIIVKK